MILRFFEHHYRLG